MEYRGIVLSKLEATIVRSAQQSLGELQQFIGRRISDEERVEALNYAAESAAFIKLGMHDSGLGRYAARELQEMEPFLARAIAAIEQPEIQSRGGQGAGL